MLAEYAQPYRFNSEGQGIETLHWTWDPYPAAGVLRSTATDMMKYLKLALQLAGPIALIEGAATAETAYTRNGAGYGQGLAWEYVPLYKKSLVGAVASASYLESRRHRRVQYMGWSSVQTDETRFGHRRIVERRGHSDRSARPFHTDAVV
jgi:hypothetical protein